MLCSSGFVDGVIFPHNRANGPKSKTTRIVSYSSPGGGTGGKVCRLRLHLERQDGLRTKIKLCRVNYQTRCGVVQFLPRDAMLARYMWSSCVRPSVRPSVTRRYCIKTTSLNVESCKQCRTIAQGL